MMFFIARYQTAEAEPGMPMLYVLSPVSCSNCSCIDTQGQHRISDQHQIGIFLNDVSLVLHTDFIIKFGAKLFGIGDIIAHRDDERRDDEQNAQTQNVSEE